MMLGADHLEPRSNTITLRDSRPASLPCEPQAHYGIYTEALLAQTFQTVACNAVHSVEARCCRWILATQYRVGRNELLLTHEFLAEMLGVQRSTVTVVTRTLQTAGLIAQRRGVITVVDPAGLEESACECHGAIRRNLERLLPRTYSHS